MNIVFTTRAEKDLEQLDKDSRKRVYIALENLIAGQRVDIKKLRGSENYRIRVGDYRVIIEISKQAVQYILSEFFTVEKFMSDEVVLDN